MSRLPGLSAVSPLRQNLEELTIKHELDRSAEIDPNVRFEAEGVVREAKKTRTLRKSHITKPEMLVCFNDTQLSRNGDHEAIGAFLEFVDHHKDRITHLVANGDITDYEQQSKFAKLPDSYGEAAEEIEATRWLFRTLTELVPNAKKVMVDGNHDARWDNMLKDQTMGLEEWVRTPDDMFRFKELGWEHIKYGRGQYYRWHNMIFWHGHRAGAKSNIPKLELEDSGVSGSSGHVNRNMYWETRNAFGERQFWVTLGGFSKDNLAYVKGANTRWTQGFGVFHYSKETGVVPQIIPMSHGTPRFFYDGYIFDGTGFEIPTTGRKSDSWENLKRKRS